MELKLVYRVLRKISDWTVSGYYSELYIEGQENIGREGPLIVASTHHNEIIDIATLAATIPYRRHLSFWAKSSMFVNPITRHILLSTGAIPVKRNPNNTNGSTNTNGPPSGATSASSQSSLFYESSKSLAAGEVIGVFPEGTSYTEPSIAQIMPGAAWAAVEYMRWITVKDLGEEKKDLTIVPVGIVYTDKAHYLSRIIIRYGVPIAVRDYTNELFKADADVDVTSRLAVKKIMEDVEKQMREMSINAPDWDTMYAAEMARDILWGDGMNIPLKDWVNISQTLIDLFTAPSQGSPSFDNDSQLLSKASLTKYYALLHYTRIKHSTLNTLLPTTDFLSQGVRFPRPLRLLAKLPESLLGLVLFIPPMLFHVPAYLTGALAGKFLAPGGEEEAKAQFKAIGGGVGLGFSVGLVLGLLKKMRWLDWSWGLVDREDGPIAKVKWLCAMFFGAYSSFYLLIKWHNIMVYSNYNRLQTLITLYKLCIGLAGDAASKTELAGYIRPPPPPPNPFIKKRNGASQTKQSEETKPAITPPRSGKLIRPLLEARKEAFYTLGEYLKNGRNRDVSVFLRRKGARMPFPE